jgi:hypothetical protein
VRGLKAGSARVLENRASAQVGPDDLDRRSVDGVAARVDHASREDPGPNKHDAGPARRRIGHRDPAARHEAFGLGAHRRGDPAGPGPDRPQSHAPFAVGRALDRKGRDPSLGHRDARARDKIGVVAFAVGDENAHEPTGREPEVDGRFVAPPEGHAELDG